MKKTTITLLAASVAGVACGGGLLHNTNQHINFVRMMARGASTDIDAVFTNPAGLAFMDHEGWSLSLNIQSAYQSRDVRTTFPLFPEADHTRLYEGDAAAPVLPSVYAAYHRGPWTVSGFLGVIGGGGKCSFDSGLPVFDTGVMAGVYAQTLALRSQLAANPATAPLLNDPAVAGLLPLTPDRYTISTAMKGRQYIYGAQAGATYRLNDHWSAYAGFRMDYFDGNYSGYVNVRPGAELATTVQQLAAARPELAGMLGSLAGSNGNMATIALDCNQSGWGVTPIIGVDYRWDRLTLAAKYEFKTNLNIENDTKTATAEPAAFESALDDYRDGVNTPSDLPGVLYVAAGYEFIPERLRGTLEYHYYGDTYARMAHDKQKALRHGTHELLAGVEWDINRTFTVSAGFQNTDYGLSDAYQTHSSFSCDSYSIGFGAAVNVSPKIRVNVGYFWTNYKDYHRSEADYFGTTLPGEDTYSRTNKVFGAGVDFKF